MPDDAPSSARECPRCGYDLNRTIEDGLRRCPECGYRFSEDDIDRLYGEPVTNSAPRSLPPHERRFSGPLVLLVGAIIVITAVVLTFFLSASF